VAPVGTARGGDVLDRGGAHGRQRERDARRRGGPGSGALALGVHHPGEPGGRDAERQFGAPPQHVPASVHFRDVAEDRRVELDVLERLPGPRQRELGLGRALGVVERGPGRAPLGDPPQVLDRQRRAQAPPPAVEVGLLEADQGQEVLGAGELSLRHVRAY
jgi:hypothetical protein